MQDQIIKVLKSRRVLFSILCGMLAAWFVKDGIPFALCKTIDRYSPDFQLVLLVGLGLSLAVVFFLVFGFLGRLFAGHIQWVERKLDGVWTPLKQGLVQLMALFTIHQNTLLVLGGILLALLLRYGLFQFRSGDYTYWVQPWYATFKQNGFAALKENFANYNPPYLYLLYLASLLFSGLEDVVAIKLVAVIFDLVCAYFVYKIVQCKYQGPLANIPILAFFAVLFSPTVVLNGSFWGQADIFYTTALVIAVYFLIKQKEPLAFVFLGIAFSIKLQGLFLLPMFLVLLFKGRVKWEHFLIIPLVYFLLLLPARFAGRPLSDLLAIYLNQADAGQYLTGNAANLYQWLPDHLYSIFMNAGLIWTAAVVFLFIFLVYKSREPITSPVMIQLALLSALIMPYCLPKMHDRYFFPADIFAIVYGFYFPKQAYIPVVVIMSSFFAYSPFLFEQELIPLKWVALALLAAIAVVVYHLIRTLYPQVENNPD